MELLADRDPEEARKILDPLLERMMNAVHRYEGTVNQVMGDGIMALFGAPLAHEDHAVRACYAALRMQDAVRRYSDELRRAQGVEMQIRVGLNSGDVAGAGSSSRSSASRASGSRASTTSSSILITPMGGSSSKAARCPTARRPRTCRWPICCAPISRLRAATMSGRSGPR